MAIQIDIIDLKQTGSLKQAHVTLAQVQVPDPSKVCPDAYLDTIKIAEKKNLLDIQCQRIRKNLKRALVDDSNFILFPELSIPWEMQDELRETAIKENVYIIGGVTYGPDYQNTCAIFPPFKFENLPLQYKLNRAPAEDKNVQTGQRILIFKNSGFGTFASVICYDFTSLHIAREIQKNGVNILFLPTLNPAVKLFDEMAIGQCYSIYAYLCLCNSAGSGLGNSASYGPVRISEGGRLQQERVIGKIAATQETTFTTVLDIPGLLESIKKFKDNINVLPGFITPPADLREPGILISPYTPLGPAKENFVGRKNQVREFWACIESKSHVLLLGPSGTGKTSLIYRLRAEALIEYRTGFIEVYDTENTFDFFRRLSIEITSRAETKQRSVQFEGSIQSILNDINKTQDAVIQHGFQQSSRAFIEAFHNLALAIDAQKFGKIVIFIDQAERLAWLEENPDKQNYAIRILIKIMRDLEVLGTPILFAIAIRQHDYDPLIALASDHIPARVVALQKFAINDAILSVERPLPPEITIERAVSIKIAELSGGIPFFVQLLADATFKRLGQRKVISNDVFDELNIKNQRDIFPLLMNSLTPTEQRFVEAMGGNHEYTIRTEDIAKELNMELGEVSHIVDLLLGKNIIESLENDMVRFVHDQMKGFIQREWLATRMGNREKLRSETETALQMLFVSPEDDIAVSFSAPPIAVCCFKSLILNDIENLSRILEQVGNLKHDRIAMLCVFVLNASFRNISRNVFNNIRSKLASDLEKNNFFFHASLILTIEIRNREIPDLETVQRAIDLAEKSANQIKDEDSMGRIGLSQYIIAANWAMSIGDSLRKNHLFKKFSDNLNEIATFKTNRGILIKNDGRIISGRFGWPTIMDDLFVEDFEKRRKMIFGQSGSFFYGFFQYMGIVADLDRGEEYFGNKVENLKLASQLSLEYLNKKDNTEFLSIEDCTVISEFAEKIGDNELREELYRKAIELGLRNVEKKEKDETEGPFQSASELYAEIAGFTEKIGDGKHREELYRKAIELGLRNAEKREKDETEESYSRALDIYAKTAELAEKVRDDNLREKLYRKAIELGLRNAKKREKDETEESYSQTIEIYAEIAKIADKIGDNELREELFRKGIELGLRYAEKREKDETEEKYYLRASKLYARTAELAEKVGDDNLREEQYRKAIELQLKNASLKERDGNFLYVSSSYIQAAKWAKAIKDNPNVDTYYGKASQSLRAAVENYEKIASLLLDYKTRDVLSALNDYFSNVEDEFEYFDKVSSVAKECRSFFYEIRGLQW